ncbi:hypothetical protein Tco_0374594 [Tanacetum coccineum]
MKSITEGHFKQGTFIHNSPEDAADQKKLECTSTRRDHHVDVMIVFEALINDMRNIKMTMPIMQLNSKFVNNMLPERIDFFTEVKLNRGLKESNFDQLYAYLKQHEVHANENRMMMERFIQPTNDPLALVSNASNQKNNATVQDDRVVVQDVRGRYNANNQGRPFQRNNARGNVEARNAGGQNRDGNVNPAVVVSCRKHATNFDDDVDDLALNVDHVFEADQCDAFDSDVDEAPTTQTSHSVNLYLKFQSTNEVANQIDSKTPFRDNEDQVVKLMYLSVRNEMHDVNRDKCMNRGVQSRIMKSEILKVHMSQNDYFKLKGNTLNLQLKYQHLQESFDNKKSQASQEAPDFNSFFKIKNLEHQIQEKDNVIRDLKVHISNVNEQNTSTNEKTSSFVNTIDDSKEAYLEGNLESCTKKFLSKQKLLASMNVVIDVEPIPPRLKNNRNAHLTYINHLKESVETVREIV